jgi:hypothetical protein
MPIGAVVIVAALLVYAATLIFTSSDDRILVILFSMAGFLLSLIALAVYSYYIKIKLRYTWFLFMDMYGTAYSYDALVAEMNKLNDISKSDTFKKSLVANLGTDSVKVLTQSAVSMISRGMSYFGGEAGRVLGAITQIYAQEATRQITDLANIAAQYILYRFARKELRGEEQAVNETLYQLK